MSEYEKVPACEWCQMFRNWKEREQCAFCRGEEPLATEQPTKEAEGPKE